MPNVSCSCKASKTVRICRTWDDLGRRLGKFSVRELDVGTDRAEKSKGGGHPLGSSVCGVAGDTPLCLLRTKLEQLMN